MLTVTVTEWNLAMRGGWCIVTVFIKDIRKIQSFRCVWWGEQAGVERADTCERGYTEKVWFIRAYNLSAHSSKAEQGLGKQKKNNFKE